MVGIGGLLGGLVGEELLLLAVDDVLAGVEVAFVGADTFALGDPLVAEEEGEVDGDADVAGDEGRVVVLEGDAGDEGVEVLGDGDEDADEEGHVRAPDAQGRRVRHHVVRDALGLARAHEPDVRHEDGDPGEQTQNGGHVDEVAEHLLRVVRHVQEGEEAEQGRGEERVDGDAAAVGLAEDGRGRAVRGEAVEGAAGDVEIRVGGGEDEEQDGGVEDVRERVDLGERDGDDEGRGRRAGVGAVGERELLVVVGHEHADEEDADEVEDDDTVERELDRARDRLPRVLGFSDRHADQLRSEKGEGRRDESRVEGEESS